jgi:hypothetical protein
MRLHLGWDGVEQRSVGLSFFNIMISWSSERILHRSNCRCHCVIDSDERRTAFLVLALTSLTQNPANDIFYQVFPNTRNAHSIGPGIEIRDDPAERRRRDGELDNLTSLE